MKTSRLEPMVALSAGSQIIHRLAAWVRCGNCRGRLVGFSWVAGLALTLAGGGGFTARAQDPGAERARMLAEQQRPRTAVPFDPKQFDRFVGSYQMGPGFFFTITRYGDHLMSRLTSQKEVEVYPESPTKFFARDVAAQLSFVTDAAGNASEIILHQGGMEQHGRRVDDAVKNYGETSLAERIKNNLPDPEREPLLRRNIEALIKGVPDLDDMAPGLVAATNQQWPAIQKSFGGTGALKSLVFDKVDARGFDIYLATFENREIQFLIGPLSADQKMQGLLMRPAPDAATKERIKNNVADPEREPPLRRFVAALISGQPNLEDMGPGLVAATHQQWASIRNNFAGNGALKSLDFKSVDAMGMDVYLGTFENGQVEFLIGPLSPDHKMQGLLLRSPQ